MATRVCTTAGCVNPCRLRRGRVDRLCETCIAVACARVRAELAAEQERRTRGGRPRAFVNDRAR